MIKSHFRGVNPTTGSRAKLLPSSPIIYLVTYTLDFKSSTELLYFLIKCTRENSQNLNTTFCPLISSWVYLNHSGGAEVEQVVPLCLLPNVCLFTSDPPSFLESREVSNNSKAFL